MNTLNIEKLDRLKEFIDFYTKLIYKIIKNSPEISDIDNLDAFIKYLFLQRFCYNSKAVYRLFNHYKKDYYFKIPISILLRTCMSDFLTYYYFMKIVKDNLPKIDKINNEILEYLVSNLHYFKRDLNEKLKEGLINDKENTFIWDTLQIKYPILFDKVTKNLIKSDCKSFKDIYNVLRNDKTYKWTSEAYSYYDYFSKFEHIGILTYDTQELHKIDENLDVNRFLLSIALFSESIFKIINNMPIKTKYTNDLKEMIKLGKRLKITGANKVYNP